MRACYTARVRAPVVFFASLLLVASAFAGDITVQTGYSNTNPSGINFFRVGAFDRPVFQTLFGYSWTIHEWKHIRLTYHADIIPVMRISDPAEMDTIDFSLAGVNYHHVFPAERTLRKVHRSTFSQGGDQVQNISGTIAPVRLATHGGGANPVGTEVFLRLRKRIQPFAILTAGFLVFPHDEPVDSTSYFNFSYAFGGGVDYRIREKQAITIGYKLLHMSNAELGATNPGVNTNFLYIGYRFGR